MERCEWCGKENDDKFEVVIVGLEKERWRVCGGCLNLYANNHFDELNDKVRKAREKVKP